MRISPCCYFHLSVPLKSKNPVEVCAANLLTRSSFKVDFTTVVVEAEVSLSFESGHY
ncbi:MAG: hypothetical protein WED05_07400 [Candidatus Atabeyarchaeum deiterrae]